jgi:hypothetical protein
MTKKTTQNSIFLTTSLNFQIAFIKSYSLKKAFLTIQYKEHTQVPLQSFNIDLNEISMKQSSKFHFKILNEISMKKSCKFRYKF